MGKLITALTTAFIFIDFMYMKVKYKEWSRLEVILVIGIAVVITTMQMIAKKYGG